MLMRRETIDLGRQIEGISKNGVSDTVRRVYVGERSSGKTVMLLQAMAMAMVKGWVVINIPDGMFILSARYPCHPTHLSVTGLIFTPTAMDLTIANTEYEPLPKTSPLQYIQPKYTANLLAVISRANPVLQTITLSQQQHPSISVPLPPNMSLARLAQLGAEDSANAWPIFELLLSELRAPGRPPIMMCLDGLGFAMRATKYIDGTHYRPIHAHSLSLLATYLSYLSGDTPLPNGGMVLAAVSESNRPNVDALTLALGQIEGRQEVQRDPFKAYDKRVMSVFEGKDVEVQRLAGVARPEARGLMEYWARSGMVRRRVTEDLIAERWAVAGGGLVGELERACVRMRI